MAVQNYCFSNISVLFVEHGTYPLLAIQICIILEVGFLKTIQTIQTIQTNR